MPTKTPVSDEPIKVHENKVLAKTFIKAKGDTKKS